MNKFISGAFTSLFFIFPLLGSGQSYPTKPVRLIIAFPTGGGTDLVGRVLAQRFATQTGQQMIADNRTGAGGNVAAEIVARLPADGYSLLLTTNSITVNATLYPKLKYDLLKDFAPISLLAEVPLVLTIHPSVPVRSVKELIAFGRKNKGKLSFGSNGSGTTICQAFF